jgi:hypothetical protein
LFYQADTFIFDPPSLVTPRPSAATLIEVQRRMVPVEEPEWNSQPAWKLPKWAEPLVGCSLENSVAILVPKADSADAIQMVASILFGAMYMTRRRNCIPSRDYTSLASGNSNRSSDELLPYDCEANSGYDYADPPKYPSKRRNCCGLIVRTPNTARFRRNIHSRILQKFPFLIEMFYWVINYLFYRLTWTAAQALFAESGIWNVAKRHGIAVLEGEQHSLLRFLLPIKEREVQQWFMHDHQGALTALNKAYALIHIPGTVG